MARTTAGPAATAALAAAVAAAAAARAAEPQPDQPVDFGSRQCWIKQAIEPGNFQVNKSRGQSKPEAIAFTSKAGSLGVDRPWVQLLGSWSSSGLQCPEVEAGI